MDWQIQYIDQLLCGHFACGDGSFHKLMIVSDIDMLEEFAYLRTPEGGRIQLELLPNQGMLIK